jgi:hypothetical protein
VNLRKYYVLDVGWVAYRNLAVQRYHKVDVVVALGVGFSELELGASSQVHMHINVFR